jgi:4-hydroxybenzoate polyprenyltransferase
MVAPAQPESLARVGTARALWRLSRPRFALWILWIPCIGYGFAHWDRALDWTRPAAFLVVLLAWSLLNAGALWLNAALDRDDAGALYARATPLPEHVRSYGYASLALAVVLAGLASAAAGLCAAACALLAVLYSHPVTAWKGHPILGPSVNALGYGILSGLAGWVLVGVGMNLRTALTFALMTLWLLGATFAAQAFQQRDDTRHGYRTLVVTHGPRVCLMAARLCMDGAVVGVLALAAFGWYPRIILLAAPVFLVAERWMRSWLERPDGGDPRWAAGLIQRMLIGGMVMFALVYADYLYSYYAGVPVAGLATAAGRPAPTPGAP